jgi:hypothetical protein
VMGCQVQQGIEKAGILLQTPLPGAACLQGMSRQPQGISQVVVRLSSPRRQSRCLAIAVECPDDIPLLLQSASEMQVCTIGVGRALGRLRPQGLLTVPDGVDPFWWTLFGLGPKGVQHGTYTSAVCGGIQAANCRVVSGRSYARAAGE